MCASHRCQRDWPHLRKRQLVRLEIALLNARGFNKIMASGGGGAKRNGTLLDFNFIKKKEDKGRRKE